MGPQLVAWLVHKKAVAMEHHSAEHLVSRLVAVTGSCLVGYLVLRLAASLAQELAVSLDDYLAVHWVPYLAALKENWMVALKAPKMVVS